MLFLKITKNYWKQTKHPPIWGDIKKGKVDYMRLVELLSILNENTNVVLFDMNNVVLDIYDGKNSINDIYNNYEVIEINHTRNDLEIVIDFIDFDYIMKNEDTKSKYEDLCDYVADNRYNDLYLFWQ